MFNNEDLIVIKDLINEIIVAVRHAADENLSDVTIELGWDEAQLMDDPENRDGIIAGLKHILNTEKVYYWTSSATWGNAVADQIIIEL